RPPPAAGGAAARPGAGGLLLAARLAGAAQAALDERADRLDRGAAPGGHRQRAAGGGHAVPGGAAEARAGSAGVRGGDAPRQEASGIDMFVDFLYELRERGVKAGPQEAMQLARALALELHGTKLDGFYQVARALCVHREQELDAFDRAFAHHFHGVPDEA